MAPSNPVVKMRPTVDETGEMLQGPHFRRVKLHRLEEDRGHGAYEAARNACRIARRQAGIGVPAGVNRAATRKIGGT